MKFFTRDGLFKKIVIAIIIVILVNFSVPTFSYGVDIVDPIVNFLILIPDGIFYILQYYFMGEGDVRLLIHSDEYADGGQRNGSDCW